VSVDVDEIPEIVLRHIIIRPDLTVIWQALSSRRGEFMIGKIKICQGA